MSRDKAQTIAYAIRKECQKDSLYEWCENWDITIDEFEEFLANGINGAMKNEKAFEIWKDINGFEGIYQISDKGNIRSLDREIICSNGSVRFQRGTEIKPYINKQGYRTVVLHNIGKHKMCRICRLVAEAFIPNPQNLPQVNHKDENKANDEKENLEWCTCLYNLTYNNLHHRRNNKNNKKSKPVAQIKCGKIIKVFPSIREVERVLGFQNGNISQCCNGKTKTSYGYEWAYLKGSEVIERIN